MSSLATLKAAAEKINAQKEELRKIAEATLKDVLQGFLKDWPEIKSIMWVQYTPYFNDGEECVFSVNDPYYCTEKYEYFEYEPEEGFNASEWSKKYKAEQGKNLPVSNDCYDACIMLTNLLTNDLCDEMRYVFEDHVSVVVNEDGVSIEEHEHD